MKVTKEQVAANMQDILVRTEIEFEKPVTYVTVRMNNGFTIRESTTCVDPKNYDEKIGKEICLEKIEDKVWMLLGYELQSKVAEASDKVTKDEDETLGGLIPDMVVEMLKELGFNEVTEVPESKPEAPNDYFKVSRYPVKKPLSAYNLTRMPEVADIIIVSDRVPLYPCVSYETPFDPETKEINYTFTTYLYGEAGLVPVKVGRKYSVIDVATRPVLEPFIEHIKLSLRESLVEVCNKLLVD